MPTSGRASEISTTSQSVDDDEDDDETSRDKRRRRSVSKKSNKRRSSGGGKDGKGERKLITPPPIIGPDGKELPRPTDPEGRPLPIYVDEDKKPILDGKGNPIAVRFQKDGKPIPYEKFVELAAKGGGGGSKSRSAVVAADNGTSSQIKIPRYCLWVGLTDFIFSLIFVIYYAWMTGTEASNDGGRVAQLAATVALFAIAMLAVILPYFAVKKNKQSFLWIWCAIAIVLLLCQIGASATLDEKFVKNSIFVAVLYCFFRIALVGGTVCCIAITDDSPSERYVVASGGYPRGAGGGGTQTIVVQSPRAYPAYGYGYGYGGPSYGEAALLGLAAGSMMGGYHHHYYDPYWGGGWGYGGYGGYDGFYDDYGYF